MNYTIIATTGVVLGGFAAILTTLMSIRESRQASLQHNKILDQAQSLSEKAIGFQKNIDSNRQSMRSKASEPVASAAEDRETTSSKR